MQLGRAEKSQDLWPASHRLQKNWCFSLSVKVEKGQSSSSHSRAEGAPSFFLVFLPFSRAAPTAYGGSQSNQSCSRRPTPQPQQRRIRAVSATYTTAHGNAGSLNPLSKARDPTCNLMVPSRIRFHCAMTGTPHDVCFNMPQ